MDLNKIMPIAIIIFLLSIIITLLIFNTITDDKSGFTELYFTGDLPKIIEMNQEYDFSFVIHNLEDKSRYYDYSIYLYSNEIAKGYVFLNHDETGVIDQSFIVKNKTSFSEIYNELYFIKGFLKTIEMDEPYDLFYRIQAIDDNNITYNYSLCLLSDEPDKGYECLDHVESVVIDQSLLADVRLENISIPVSVRIKNQSQEIHFWALLK